MKIAVSVCYSRMLPVSTFFSVVGSRENGHKLKANPILLVSDDYNKSIKGKIVIGSIGC